MKHEVVVAMTANARKLVTTVPFRSLTRNAVITDIFSEDSVIAHIAITDWCDVALAVPATYNLIGKVASGIADDAVTTILAACKKPVLVVPAMNTNMYENPVFIENLKKLSSLSNYFVLEAKEGYLACGASGKGRMAEVPEIIDRMETILSAGRDLEGRRIIVTAGPTREYIDSVRFVSNPSTGKMGYAIAKEAAARGALVVLISGPAALPVPEGLEKFAAVETTAEMLDAVLAEFPRCDALVSAAAPCDFRFPRVLKKKAAKSDLVDKTLPPLEATPDILKSAARLKKNQIVVGFAAEDNRHMENAARKLAEKSMDMIVLNDVSSKESGFASDYNEITIMRRGKPGEPENIARATKEACAKIIIDRMAALLPAGARKRRN